jgi:hypothetical protein
LCNAEEERIESLEQEEGKDLNWQPNPGDGAQKDEEGGHEWIDKIPQGQYHIPRMGRPLCRSAIPPH